ncbi:hypothetical protein HYC85_018067 [Camellia sinensis]|uniref:Uncharacterized protein n=1 Tax=Camellia sinensis TaxID=4442 RepID=A0A7J7GTI5_CAMSI|nr:hypothetical protein HYC85_018067 [Camellia sinensis]
MRTWVTFHSPRPTTHPFAYLSPHSSHRLIIIPRIAGSDAAWRRVSAAGEGDDNVTAGGGQRSPVDAVSEASQADEPACVHLRYVQPRHDSPNPDSPLLHSPQSGLPSVRCLRF